MNPSHVFRRATLISTAVFALSLFAEEPAEVLLWPNGAPGSEGKTSKEAVRVTQAGEHVLSNVHAPSITPFLPAEDEATGAAVIVIPGGGHRELWMDHEGMNVAKWLRDHGVAAFVLKYRLARETNSTYRIDVEALADTQRAIRLVRSRAAEWKIDPVRVGAIGFSAGGELVSLAGTRFDSGNPGASDSIERQSSKPGFQGLIYPGRSGDIQPTTNSPPAFLACAFNDRKDISEGLAEVYLRFKRVGVPAELHIYSNGGHGFGLRLNNDKPVSGWIVRFNEWLEDNGFLTRQ